MQPFLSQLTLRLNSNDDATFVDFCPEGNEEAILALKESASGIGEKIVYVCGQPGVGRSHLLQACCHEAHQHQRTSVYLPMANLVSLNPAVLGGLETLDLVCMDDIDVIAGQVEWEEAIFHLYNRIYDAAGSIVVSAGDLPKAIHIRLADLVSRLNWGATYQLHPLSDEAKKSVLLHRAEKRGMVLSDEVANYILTHCPRQLNALFSTLDVLDQATLSAQRRLTIPFIKETLQIKA